MPPKRQTPDIYPVLTILTFSIDYSQFKRAHLF